MGFCAYDVNWEGLGDVGGFLEEGGFCGGWVRDAEVEMGSVETFGFGDVEFEGLCVDFFGCFFDVC